MWLERFGNVDQNIFFGFCAVVFVVVVIVVAIVITRLRNTILAVYVLVLFVTYSSKSTCYTSVYR